MKNYLLLSILVLSFSLGLIAQPAHRVVFKVAIADSLQDKFRTDGRLFIFISENPYGQPRYQLWPVSPRAENGLPAPLFDPVTGEIDRDVAEYWK